MAYGVNWVFERGRMGDYQAGYRKPPAADYPLGLAVAASACFPPLFNPLPAGVTPSELTGGRATPGAERDACIAGMRLTDGGCYDNMGLEPASYLMDGGYSEDLAKSVVADIRTDLDAFSDAEAAVLENHGYLMVDAAIRRHVGDLLPQVPAPLPPLRIPKPEWMDEDRVRRALKDSGRRTVLGRS
jgi:hypothetical protein